MKILDRYVLLAFLRNYLISFMVLIGLYVVLDMVFSFDELAEANNRTGGSGGLESMLAVIRAVLDFYAHQTLLFFVHLSGFIPVVAAGFTLIRMVRNNELTAILAAGVPLLRVAAPIILVGVVLNFVLLPIDQELIIPRVIPKLVRRHDEVMQAATRTFPIKAMRDDANGILVAARYHPPTPDTIPWMEEMDVIRRGEDKRPIAHLRAHRAHWDAELRGWRLTDGVLTEGLAPGQPRGAPMKVEVYKSSITPEEIALYRSGDYVELLSTERINQLLRREQSYGMADLLRVKHTRFAQIPLNIILLLLAVSCLLTREPGQLRSGVLRCALVVGLCMATIFVSHQLAGTPPAGAQWSNLWPAMMAWAPILIFGALAVVLLDRVRT